MLISLETLSSLAERHNFRVHRGGRQVELWLPDNNGATALWHDGSCYSTADIVLSSCPNIGYGHNDAFNGPYHYGYARADSYGVRALMAHINAA